MKGSFDSFLEVNGVTTKPGSKCQGHISVEGTSIKMPVTYIKGERPGKQVLITGGVHGGEYPCIETAIRLSRQIDPLDVLGSLVIIHPVNVPAFLAKLQYYGPFDGKNLNRVFPGKDNGTESERMAYVVHQLQQAADFYIDLHGGDIHESLVPFVIYSNLGGEELSSQSRKAAAAMGFPYVVGSVSDNGSIGSAAKAGTPGFLAELGQCGRWTEEEVTTYMQATTNVLKTLGVMAGAPQIHPGIEFLSRMLVITSSEDGCWYPFRKLRDKVHKGEVIGETRDFFGKALSEYHAEEDGVLLYVVTSLAITKGDPLAAIGTV